MLSTKITRYGNSLAIRLPAGLAKEMQMREGDSVMIERDGTRLTIEREELPTLEEMLATVTAREAELETGSALGAEDFE
jgi:antitoxin MazE